MIYLVRSLSNYIFFGFVSSDIFYWFCIKRYILWIFCQLKYFVDFMSNDIFSWFCAKLYTVKLGPGASQ